MARVTHVKKAQPRYATVPVIDPATGEQKVVPVMRPDGTQKTTKRGRPVVRKLTRADKSQPLPNRRCDRCGNEIKPGDPYKWIAPRSGPYGGHKRFRCGACPTWQVWEYSSSLSARLAQIAHDFWEAQNVAESPDDIQGALEVAAEEVRGLAEEKRESAQNIEDGFGHPTYQSEELEQTADDLESWADEIENADVPDLPEPDPEDCDDCDGGQVERTCDNCGGDLAGRKEGCSTCHNQGTVSEDCDECDGSGEVESDEPTEEQMDEWRDDVAEACSIVDESPV